MTLFEKLQQGQAIGAYVYRPGDRTRPAAQGVIREVESVGACAVMPRVLVQWLYGPPSFEDSGVLADFLDLLDSTGIPLKHYDRTLEGLRQLTWPPAPVSPQPIAAGDRLLGKSPLYQLQNDEQYQSTQAWADHFDETLAAAESSPYRESLRGQLERDSLRSMRDDLRAQLAEYDSRQAAVTQPIEAGQPLWQLAQVTPAGT